LRFEAINNTAFHEAVIDGSTTFFDVLAASGTSSLNLPSTPGNTGVDGLWLFEVRGGTLFSSGGSSIFGSSTLFGGGGDDARVSGRGGNSRDGGGGIDAVDYSGAFAGVTVDLGLNTADNGFATDTLSSVE